MGLRHEVICQHYFDLRGVIGSLAHLSFTLDEVRYRRRTNGLVCKPPLLALVGVGNAVEPRGIQTRRTRRLLGLQPHEYRIRWERLDEVYCFSRREPYLHVSALTVLRPCRGRGSAGRWLASLESAGLPIYLETATPANRSYYERRGFLVQETRALTKTSSLWSLLKLPPGV